MQLTPEQLQQFDELGYLFLPGCFTEEEVAVLRDEAEAIYRHRPPGGVAREDRARRAPPSPPTPTTRRSACSAAIRA